MFDLHVHTTASDGELTPTEIVKLAEKENVKTIAICDHDTIDGLEEAIVQGEKSGVEVIPGIELNAKVPKGKMHVLGYYVDYKDEKFANTMLHLKKDRDERNQEFIKEFNKQGINITIEDVKKNAFGNVLAKPHFARALLDRKYISDIEETYTNYFNVPPMNQIKRKSITPNEAFDIIKQAGGIVVLAHPITLKLDYDELEMKIKELKEMGLDGIECYNNIHTEDDIKKLREIAVRNNLLITAGSDFHGPISTPDVKIGRGINNNIIPKENDILEKLKK